MTTVPGKVGSAPTTATRGSVMIKGAAGWQELAPGTAGTVLTSAGAGANPTYSPVQWSSRLLHPFGFTTGNATTNLSIGSVTCPAWYIGRAPYALTTVDVRLRVTVAMSGITWAQIFIAKGAPVLAGNASLTVVGYTGIASWTPAGLFTHTIAVAGGQSIAAGDDFWIGFAKLATGSPSLRASSVGDDVTSGCTVDAGNVKPQTLLGTPTTFTLAANTVTTPWLVVAI